MHRFWMTLITGGLLLGAAGCASTSSSTGPLRGDHAAHFTDVWTGVDPENLAPMIAVEHTFSLHNPGPKPVTIVDHRTRINTVWGFVDTGNGRLPRTIAPGETVQVAMTAKVRKPEPQRFFAELTLDTGEVVMLEMFVKG